MSEHEHPLAAAAFTLTEEVRDLRGRLNEAERLLQSILTVHDVVGDDAEGTFDAALDEVRVFLDPDPTEALS